MKYQAVKGMEDILPQNIRIWQELERRARIELESNGYKEIRTPLLEETAVFTRSIGETTDIVTKEMYTFSDRKERSLTLRPEGTAPIVRAYIEHSLDKISHVLQLYYIGPMFRSERPQKGRSRQFHQIGVEIIGSRSPQVDFEVIWRLNKLLQLFELEGFLIKLNSLGCKKDKAGFADKLQHYLKGENSRLCDDCKIRIDKNVLRVLDCKKESCISVVRNAPNIQSCLCPECVLHFSTVRAMLQGEGVNFEDSKNLVRGLDYYTGTVFEIVHPGLGSQDALGAGGRYDNLVKDMGGPDVGAVGFAVGMERVMIAFGDKKDLFPKPMVIYIATVGKKAKSKGFRLAEEIKEKLNNNRVNVTTLIDLGESSLNSQMRRANKNSARLTIIIFEDTTNMAIIKDMEKCEDQVSVGINDVVQKVREITGMIC